MSTDWHENISTTKPTKSNDFFSICTIWSTLDICWSKVAKNVYSNEKSWPYSSSIHKKNVTLQASDFKTKKNYKKKNELTLSLDEETWDKSLEFSDRCVLENVSFFPHPFVDFWDDFVTLKTGRAKHTRGAAGSTIKIFLHGMHESSLL